jgi:hypothetical protein
MGYGWEILQNVNPAIALLWRDATPEWTAQIPIALSKDKGYCADN